MEGAPWGNRPRTVTHMPVHWWGLHKTNYAPQLRPSTPRIGTAGMDLTTLLKAENDFLWLGTEQHPMQHLLRNGSMVPDKVPGGGPGYDKTRCTASGKIFLQPVSKYRTGLGSRPVTYEEMLEDMRDVFSNTSRFIFQDQCVPFLDVRVERYMW